MENKINKRSSDSELETYVNYISPMSIRASNLIYNTAHVSSKNLSTSEKIEYISSHVYRNTSISTSDIYYDVIAGGGTSDLFASMKC